MFGWTDSTITLLTLWGSLDFPLFFFPSAFLLKKSLRWSVVSHPTPSGSPPLHLLLHLMILLLPCTCLQVAGGVCMLVGPSIRCLPLLIPALSPHFTLFCHAGDKRSPKPIPGAIINAMAGPVAMAAPIQISAAWFPPHVGPLIHDAVNQERTRATSIGQMFNALGVRG